jgi:hypothetical protein
VSNSTKFQESLIGMDLEGDGVDVGTNPTFIFRDLRNGHMDPQTG